jgi:hypothetical protein
MGMGVDVMMVKAAVGKITQRITELTARRSRGETRDLVVHHEIRDVTPEMIDWWWDNIDTTDRYRQWHPASHLSFTWESQPGSGHVGRTQCVLEKIAGIPSLLRIRWEDPDSMAIDRIYGHVNAGSILDGSGKPISWLMHEYEGSGQGTKMRSTFRLPAKTPNWFVKGLRKHNSEEMAHFTDFLPRLYEVSRRDI